MPAFNVLNQRDGLLFYSGRPNATSLEGGVLCVQAPLRRTATQSSAGAASASDCSGSYSFDFNALTQSGLDATLVAGTEVFAQYWSRDPGSASATGLTNGLRFLIAP